MTWIIFDNVRVWKLIHVCYFLLFPWLPKKLLQLPNLELDSLLSRFYGSVRTKKPMSGLYKTNNACSFIQGVVENYCALSKIQHWPTIHRGPVGPRLNFTSGTIIFYHSHHEQSIYVYYLLAFKWRHVLVSVLPMDPVNVFAILTVAFIALVSVDQ